MRRRPIRRSGHAWGGYWAKAAPAPLSPHKLSPHKLGAPLASPFALALAKAGAPGPHGSSPGSMPEELFRRDAAGPYGASLLARYRRGARKIAASPRPWGRPPQKSRPQAGLARRGGGAQAGRTVTLSPFWTSPPARTLAKIPSLGMMQSPTR